MTACLFFQACDSADKTILSKKIMAIDSVEINDNNSINNTIAGILVNSKDAFLQIHQDTVFFQEKKFSGIIFNLYPNGDTSMTAHYFNGLEHGILKKWYPNKQLAESRSFQAGKKDGMIPGFIEGIENISFGDKAVLFIPARLGYGEAGAGNVIPSNANIIFEIELLEKK